MSKIQSLKGRFQTVREMIAAPGVADHAREWLYRSARYDGLPPCDADDAAQRGFMLWMATPEDMEPVHALYSVRRYLRRSGWKDRTGAHRSVNRRLPMPVGDIATVANSGSRAGMTDNPAAIAAAMETAGAMLMTACGRNAKAIRGMSADDIRSLVCPALQGGTPVETVDVEPMTLRPMPAQPGDGTEWRGSPDGLTVEYQNVRGFALRHWY